MFGGMSRNEKRRQEIAESRPAVEINLRERPDRVKKYLLKYMDKFVFDEFSDAYLKDQGIEDILKDVPIPLRKEDLQEFNSPKGLPVTMIAENMAWVIGIDPKFKYADKYIEYMNKVFSGRVVKALVKEAKDEGERKVYDSACIHFRAALCFDFIDLAAMYGYGRACREMYKRGGSADYVGDLKAESIEYFELLTELHPKFAEAHYYLGYAYLNLGLYQKAHIVWQDFVQKTKNSKDRKEIEERIKQLAIPIEIEKGYNSVLSQRWDDGIQILEPFLDSEYKTWWPLHYYLGVAYSRIGKRRDAVITFENALQLNPSHIETMQELADIYNADKNKEMFEKYNNKIKLIKQGGYKEKPELNADTEKEVEIKKLEKQPEAEKSTIVKKLKD